MAKLTAKTTEREHHTEGTTCWCGPVTLGYGDTLIFDGDGTLVRVEQADDDTHQHSQEEEEEEE